MGKTFDFGADLDYDPDTDFLSEFFFDFGTFTFLPVADCTRCTSSRSHGLLKVVKSLCWDVTVTCPLAESYIEGAAREAGSTAEMAASRKEEKYTEIEARHIFQPGA